MRDVGCTVVCTRLEAFDRGCRARRGRLPRAPAGTTLKSLLLVATHHIRHHASTIATSPQSTHTQPLILPFAFLPQPADRDAPAGRRPWPVRRLDALAAPLSVCRAEVLFVGGAVHSCSVRAPCWEQSPGGGGNQSGSTIIAPRGARAAAGSGTARDVGLGVSGRRTSRVF